MRRIVRLLAIFLTSIGTLQALAQTPTPTPIPVTGNLGSVSGCRILAFKFNFKIARVLPVSLGLWESCSRPTRFKRARAAL
jgi:hypothetical protein